ncbi:MAG: DNA-binding protein, partial [Planctomycetes bacterium]|nr:DNA-binding protein [Planctomycetota bacterium]
MGKATTKPPTKTEIFAAIAETTGLNKKQVSAVFDALAAEIKKTIGKRGGAGQFTVPGLCKINVL